MITNATIKTLKPSDQTVFIRDSMMRGFQIKVLPSGKALYQVEARLGGTGSVKKFKIAEVHEIDLVEARKQAT